MQTGAVQTNSEVTGGRDDAYLHQPLGGTALTDSQAAGYKRDRQCEEGGGDWEEDSDKNDSDK